MNPEISHGWNWESRKTLEGTCYVCYHYQNYLSREKFCMSLATFKYCNTFSNSLNSFFFLSYINSIHSSFQLTFNYSKECVQFFDVSVSVDNSRSITTELYVKPTDTHQYLMATSCHPNHTTRSIPYSQALCILRICSSKETAKLR